MSGGVDSSVTAYLLKENGYLVTGANLIMHSDESLNSCGCKNDVETAKELCDFMGIPFCCFDCHDRFREKVIENFARTYESGKTPNPCVVCNSEVKFHGLVEKADELGFDCIATGHYARIEKEGDRFLLKKGVDLSKDQSYVLYSLSQKQLSRTLFPLGSYLKSDVRKIAEENGFSNAHKHDSQDICFISDGDYGKYIENYLGKKFPHGEFVTLDGLVLGEHKGIIKYTVGQRKGLGLALPAPMYVYKKDAETNKVILTDEEKLFSRELDAVNINLIPFDSLNGKIRVKAKVRYKQPEQYATIEQTDKNRIHVQFEESQRAVAKGQSVVFYDGEYVIGGGIIE